MYGGILFFISALVVVAAVSIKPVNVSVASKTTAKVSMNRGFIMTIIV
jgi:hypothetical protein